MTAGRFEADDITRKADVLLERAPESTPLLLLGIELEQRSIITTISAPQRFDVTTPDIPIDVQRFSAPIYLFDAKEVLPDKFRVDP